MRLSLAVARSLRSLFTSGPAGSRMPPRVIDLQNTEDTRDVVHLAVQALAEGCIVARKRHEVSSDVLAEFDWRSPADIGEDDLGLELTE